MTDEHKHDLDLGDGHWLDWTEYKGQRCGGIIYHTTNKTETGMCAGAFWLTGHPELETDFGKRPVWQISGTFDFPTLAPSFRCHCGDHGHIVSGKWRRAG
jgi:hypothetical protein